MYRLQPVRLLHIASWLLVVLISLTARTPDALPTTLAVVAGIAFFVAGLSLFGWATANLGAAALGCIEPESGQLLTVGPYRYVRHPLYLGVFIALIGLALAFRSLWGVAAAFLLYLPASIYRARLEEAALMRCFSQEWEEYKRRTPFMFPPVY